MKRIEIGKQIAEMRSWPDDQQTIRAVLLATYLVDMFNEPEQFKRAMNAKHAALGSVSCNDLMAKGEWRTLADFIDDTLTGAPQ